MSESGSSAPQQQHHQSEKSLARWTKFSEPVFNGQPGTPDYHQHDDTLFSPKLYGASSHDPPFMTTLSTAAPGSVTQTFRGTPIKLSKQEAPQASQGLDHGPKAIELPVIKSTPQRFTVELPMSTLLHPRSCYQSFNPAAPDAKESDANVALLQVLREENSDLGEFIEFELSDFTIYIDSFRYPNELRPLHHLATRMASDKFYFDGVLSVGTRRYYVRKVPFRELPIGNYGTAEHSIDDQIWIRSEHNQKRNMEVYYKLAQPSIEYQRFWSPFYWIADLAKHVVDYCLHCLERNHRIWLNDFRHNFSRHLKKLHGKSEKFQRWYTAHASEDFRTAIAANIEFIWKEALGQQDKKITIWHGFWGEIKGGCYDPMSPSASPDLDEEARTDDNAVSEEGGTKRKRKNDTNEYITRTVVTPYIYNLFAHMGLDTIMKPMAPVKSVESGHLQQLQGTSAPQQPSIRGRDRVRKDRDFITDVVAGDVISTPPDDEGTGTEWKRETSKHHGTGYVWYGVVQEVHLTSSGRRSFDVIWMYQSRDTPCALMKYPWPNELFLSDSCTCETARIDEQDVLATHLVTWFADVNSTPASELFVRQTYLAEERCWITLHEDHLLCSHQNKSKRRSSERRYARGDTVLVKLTKSVHLEPFILESVYREGQKRPVRLRRLVRRYELQHGSCPQNELVLTDKLVKIEAKKIVRRCIVRAFLPDTKIPAPYDRGGTGDAFYMTHQQTGGDVIKPVEDPDSVPFRQGFRASWSSESQKLRGLDLFCGGGNFGRGIEEGGGVKMKWANDILPNAIHSYMANCEGDSCTPFLGSVDDLLERALTGCSGVPRPGDVQFISGGSPCQGFSRLTSIDHQETMKQRKNRSLVASFASFVDLYRPQYGLLENVQSMVKANAKREECFFSQLVCSIVGLGYQVRIVYADAWSYGSSQSRSRVFVIFAAPGVRLPEAPPPTHSHPAGIKMGTLGKMSNGQTFGERTDTPTPFKFVSSSEAAGDLPDIRDGKADYCIGFPDHRMSIGCTPRIRNQIRHIPVQPFGMGFHQAYFGYVDEKGRHVQGTMTEADRHFFFPNPKEQRTQMGTKGWSRVHPHGLFRTVVTVCGPTDRRTGTVNHWHQPRPLSVLEARRAQGFLDHEVITGKPVEQWHIVGNSVARHIALALGLAVREAWFGTLHDERPTQIISDVAGNEFLEAADVLFDATDSAQEDLGSEHDTPGISIRGFLSDVPGDPPSTPATSTSDPIEEQVIVAVHKHKRQGPQSSELKLLAKRPRWAASLL